MAYALVTKHSSDSLIISRQPSSRSWALFIALVVCGIGAAYYTPGVTLWTFIYCTLPLFLGLYTFEEWEQCVFDKTQGTVTIQSWSFVNKLRQAVHLPSTSKAVSADLLDIVFVDTDNIPNGLSSGIALNPTQNDLSGLRVMLHFRDGLSLGITNTATTGDRREQEQLVRIICEFLDLPVSSYRRHLVPESDNLFDATDSSSDVTDDNFELLNESDIVADT